MRVLIKNDSAALETFERNEIGILKYFTRHYTQTEEFRYFLKLTLPNKLGFFEYRTCKKSSIYFLNTYTLQKLSKVLSNR